MLISFRKRFIFVANIKSGSTAIEKALARHAEVAITQTRFGKHMTLAQVDARFQWIFRAMKREEFFVFGVLRDPVDFMVSLYNSHRKPAFVGHPFYTGEMEFADFWTRWGRTANDQWTFQPQSSRFTDAKGQLGMSYLIDYARLREEFPRICERLGVPAVPLPRANPSPRAIERAAVPPAIAEEILARYAADDLCLRRNTGRDLRG